MAADKSDEYVNTLVLCPAKQHLLLIKKRRPQWQRDKWNAIGGHVQVGEIPRAAAVREVEEECGIALSTDEPRFMMTLRVPSGAVVHFFVAETEKIWQAKTQTEEIVQLFKVNGLPRDLIPNMHWIIQMAIADNREAWPYTVQENGAAVER